MQIVSNLEEAKTAIAALTRQLEETLSEFGRVNDQLLAIHRIAAEKKVVTQADLTALAVDRRVPREKKV